MKAIVLLATYNGEKFLLRQLQSLVDQDYADVKIVVHDDGSKDRTSLIVNDFANKHPGKMTILKSIPTGGAKQNFSRLMQFALSEYSTPETYILCCDQDDIWDYDKISKSVREIKFYEDVYGCDIPLLIHSDLRLMDSSGELISNSFFSYQNLDARWGDHFGRLLTQNIITGCTMIMNVALLQRALPIPNESIMHDWWLGLVACAYGRVVYSSEISISYRQHDYNEIGAKRFNITYILKKALTFWINGQRKASLDECARQAFAFSRLFPDVPDSNIANEFYVMSKSSYFKKRQLMLKYKFFKIGWQRQIAWLVLV